MKALAQAELTLLSRNKAALFAALALPATMTFSMKSPIEELDLKSTGLTVGTVLLPGAIGFVLLFAVYTNLVGVFVARREELVLKRLRCGELSDRQILAGTALPAVVVALAQCALLAVAGGLVLDLEAPKAPHLAVVGVLLGLALMVAMAAVTAGVTKSTEGAQLSPMPLMLISLMGSGMVFPLDVMPDRLAAVCEVLPLTPAIELVRAGWTGGDGVGDTLTQLVTGVAWIAAAVWSVRRWFRWEPRR
ncbi:ABC transporter permease [Streptomyces sp. SAJ15]|uniref:ABC transporter permease n=1 Tax=Streptomyces sp. SAJ15 TaxID=2011095 RepID=UPI0011868811|nr:ABC transporter permease [Streptomyces sp. SAJ15]TVL92556.1 hypothetical protein CD790_12920 [Streptomyces sp. SAJ15]